MKRTYFHDYPSCTRTYATLCIYHDELEANVITELLGIEPTYSQKKGDFLRKGHFTETGGWFLKTLDVIYSRDVRYHIDILLKMINNKKHNLKLLREQGYDIRIFCFWESATGNGGPLLDYQLMSTLGELCIDVSFDIWFDLNYLEERT